MVTETAMASTRQIGVEKNRAIMTAISTAVIIALLAAYAFIVTPEVFKPSMVTIKGTVMAPGVTLNKIAFTKTGSGARDESGLFEIGGIKGKYWTALDNGYAYNVSISWRNERGEVVEAEIGTLVLDTFNESLVRDWVFQP